MRFKIQQLLFLGILFLYNVDATAQCSMCRAVLENDISGKGAGINNGIVYLMTFPYVLIALIAAGLIYKMKQDQATPE